MIKVTTLCLLLVVSSICLSNERAVASDVADQSQFHEPIRAKVSHLKTAILSSSITTTINSISANTGDRIKQGDALVELDCTRYRASEKIAIANVKSTRARYQSAKDLLEFKSIGPLEVTLSEAELDKAKAEQVLARSDVSACKINSPYEAIVINRLAQPHQFISVGEPLIEIYSTENLEIQLVVPSSWLKWLTLETPFLVRIDELDRDFRGSIARIGGSIDPISQTVQIFGTFDQSSDLTSVLSGMSGWIQFDQSLLSKTQ